MTISQGQIEKAIDTTADTIIRNEMYFCDLDGLAGMATSATRWPPASR